ncbi:MAG: hypothetical protein HOJ14_08525 [Nitrospina sp.]|nr:hypothetical protein [Nitrospina sp.]
MGAKKGTIPQSTKNRVWFKYSTLFIFKLLWENQKPGLKKTKRSLCIFMAQNNRTFKALWIKSHPKKTYPKSLEDREYLGLDVYHNIIADMRRFKDLDYLHDILAKKDKKAFFYIHDQGKLKKKK